MSKYFITSYLIFNKVYCATIAIKPLNKVILPKKILTESKFSSILNELSTSTTYFVIQLEFSMLFFNNKSVIGATATTERVFKNDWENTSAKRKTKCHGNLLNKSLNT